MIDLDSLIPGSAFFRWREAVNLAQWGLFAYPPPDVHKNIIWAAKNIADPIRNLFDKPVQIHSWWRPKSYNEFINGAPDSQHMRGIAIDLSIYTISIDEIRAALTPRLDSMNIRLELNTPTWVHVDGKKVMPGESRLFSP